MLYQTVGYPRSGTTLMHKGYIRSYYSANKEVSIQGEFFLGTHYLIDNKKVGWNGNLVSHINQNIKSKLMFLDKNPNKYSFKFLPSTVSVSYHRDILNYLNKCKILTIDRDIFDMFLSFMYQQKTNWKEAHGSSIPLIDKMYISSKDIDRFIEAWKINYKFIKSCKIHHTFNYNNLEKEMEDFFQTKNLFKNRPDTQPMKIDYRHITYQCEVVEEKFNKRLNAAL